jgi:hypothetical protein
MRSGWWLPKVFPISGYRKVTKMPDDEPSNRNVPVPDPSKLTTDQLHNEISNLKELLLSRINSIEHAISNMPVEVEKLIVHLKEIVTERFRSVERQLSQVEEQRVEQKLDTKAAVDAALTAQKEAVKEQTLASGLSIAKSEMATSEQLKQLNVTFTTAITGVLSSLNDLKERVGRIESIKQGGKEALFAVYALAGFILTLLVIGGILAAAGVFHK